MKKIFLQFLELEWVWNLRHKIIHLIFLSKKNAFKIFEKVKETKDNFKVSLFYWKRTSYLIIKTILFSCILLIIDNVLLLKILPYASFLETLSNLIVDDVFQNKVFIILSIIVSISGLLLGLFYPLLGTIASTAYSKVRTDIRDLLLTEPYSQYFIKKLASLTSLVLIVLFAGTIGYNPGIFTLSLIIFLIVRAVYSVLTIGLGIFNYFDPSKLIWTVMKDLYKITSKATIKGTHWNDKNFQNSYIKHAEKALAKIDVILQICSKEKYLQDDSFNKTTELIMNYLTNYLRMKKLIPTKSFWFPQKAKYSTVFISEMHAREMAQKIDGMLHADLIHNHNWIEEQVLKSLFNSISKFVEPANLKSIIVLQENMKNLSSKIGVVGNFYIGEIMIKEFYIIMEKVTTNNGSDDNYFSELVLLENYILMLELLAIGFFTTIENLTSEKFNSMITNISWLDKSKIYEEEVFEDVRQFFERIYLDIAFERNIEGYKITPDWAITQFLAMHYLFTVEKGISELIKLLRIYYINIFENINLSPFISSFLALRGRHTLWKMKRNFERIEPILNEFNNLQIQKKTRWPSIDIDKYKEIIDNYSDLLNSIVSNNIKNLYNVKWQENLPDLFAESYSVICEGINYSLVQNSYKKFKIYFNNFIETAVIAFNKIKFYSVRRRFENSLIIKLANQSIMDLLCVSGLTFIYSSLHNDYRFQYSCLHEWNEYFNKNFTTQEDEVDFISFLIAQFTYWQKYIFVQEGFEREHQRELLLYSKLEEKELINNEYDFGIEKGSKIIEPILKTVVNHSHNSHFSFSFAEIFIELYLRGRLSSKNREFNYRRDFWDSLLRILERQNNTSKRKILLK